MENRLKARNWNKTVTLALYQPAEIFLHELYAAYETHYTHGFTLLVVSATLALSLSIVTISCIQAQYSLLCRSTEWELLEVCNREHIAMLPWSPLKGLVRTRLLK